MVCVCRRVGACVDVGVRVWQGWSTTSVSELCRVRCDGAEDGSMMQRLTGPVPEYHVDPRDKGRLTPPDVPVQGKVCENLRGLADWDGHRQVAHPSKARRCGTHLYSLLRLTIQSHTMTE